MSEVDELKARTRAAWALGDYVKVAARLEPAARELVDACAVSAGQEVLDVAAGNGNVAVHAAREGASVVASDLTPEMVELGRMRTGSEGLAVEWIEADAEELPFEDERFDCAASAFGAMFAPRPEAVARELFRVVRPGGTVGMANWVPDGAQAALFRIARGYGPPLPEGLAEPLEWGRAEEVERRFAGLAARVEASRRRVRWEFGSFDDMWSFWGEGAGPAVALRRSLDDERLRALRDDFRAEVERWNTARDGRVEIDADYLLVVARRRG